MSAYWHIADIPICSRQCPLSGVKRTSRLDREMSAYDPKRTMSGPFQYCYLSRYDPRNRGPSMPLFNIGFVIFPDLTQLDFTGPLQVLSRLPQSATHIVAKSAAPVPSD